MKRTDILTVIRLLADVGYAFGFFLLAPLGVALVSGESVQAVCFGIGAASVIPSTLWLRRRIAITDVQHRHAAIALALLWLLLSLISSVPFLIHGLRWDNALFESFSAWTDTGLTMIPDPTTLPASLGLFRILIQWVSGLGIVLVMLFVRGPAPRAAYRLFQAEGRFEHFTMNLWQVGRTVVLIYIGYTLVGALLLWTLGVPPYHAFTHAVTSLSTGGFSTNPVGVGLYGLGPSIVAMGLMLAGGISFSSHHALVSGDVRKFFRNPEVRALWLIIVAVFGLLSLQSRLLEGSAWRHAEENLFYSIASVTSCGANTTLPLSDLPDVTIFTLLFLMLSGAAYGSTTGGLKLWRLLILGKVVRREVKRPFYPEGTVHTIRMGNNPIADSVVVQVAGYVFLYLALGFAGSLIFMTFGYQALDALFTVFSAQGNVGLNAMPQAAYFGLPTALKIQLMLHMLLGRMEIFPLLYLLRGLRTSPD
jgi:trk system potassium uptake protein TrkH